MKRKIIYVVCLLVFIVILSPYAINFISNIIILKSFDSNIEEYAYMELIPDEHNFEAGYEIGSICDSLNLSFEYAWGNLEDIKSVDDIWICSFSQGITVTLSRQEPIIQLFSVEEQEILVKYFGHDLAESSWFVYYSAYNSTPSDIKLSNSVLENLSTRILLSFKHMMLGSKKTEDLYVFYGPNVKGFIYASPQPDKLFLEVFTGTNENYSITIYGNPSQQELNLFLYSLTINSTP